MAARSSIPTKRIEFPFFEGVNNLVSPNLVKKQELAHAENVRSQTIGILEKRQGTALVGNAIAATANYGIFYFDSTLSTSKNLYRVSTVSSTTSIYYLNTSNVWTALSGGGTSLTAGQTSTASFDVNMAFVNGIDNNKYIESDGTTVRDSAYAAGHMYNSPKAYKVNYYKDKVYLADYTIGSTRIKNGVIFSSKPLGIVALADGDHEAGVTTVKVTDTKFIRTSDTLQVRRGTVAIGTLTVSAKTEDSITVSATGFAINSADELWVNGTYQDVKQYRWPDTSEGGINVKIYNTFKLTGGDNERIKMFTNIDDYMLIGNNNNIAVWNDSVLKSYDLGIGCVSDNGYVKALGTLWFIHYTGVYATNGSRPKLISAKVEKYITGATTAGLEASAAGRKGYSIFFTIGDSTMYNPDGSVNKVLRNVVLEYNMRQENWYVHTNITAKQFATFIDTTNPDKLTFISNETNLPVLELMSGTTDYKGSSPSTEIPMRIDFHPLTLASFFEKYCYPMKVVTELFQGGGVKCYISVTDEPQFFEIQGDAGKGCTVFKVTGESGDKSEPPRCRKISISLREISNRIIRLSQFALEYLESMEEEENPEAYGE